MGKENKSATYSRSEIALQIMCSIMNQHHISYLDDDKTMDKIVKLSLRYADKFIKEIYK